MKLQKKCASVAAVAAVITAGAAIPSEAAPVVGPGAPIRSPFDTSEFKDGRWVGPGMCSTSVPGTIVDKDGNTRRVMLTAGHCVYGSTLPNPDGSVDTFREEAYVPTRNGDVLLGKPVAGKDPKEQDDLLEKHPEQFLHYVFNTPDYSMIAVQDGVETTSLSSAADENGGNRGEPVQIVGIQDSRTLAPHEVSIDNIGQPLCVDGTRTGRNCGTQIFRTRHGVWAWEVGIDHGDSGGNAYNPETREAVGIVSMGVGPLSRYQPVDVALEEAYGIEDGKVNERFKVEQSTAPQSEFRTINEDRSPESKKKGEKSIVEDIFGELPIPNLPSPAINAEIPQLPQVPQLPKAPVEAPNFANIASQTLNQAGLPALF